MKRSGWFLFCALLLVGCSAPTVPEPTAAPTLAPTAEPVSLVMEVAPAETPAPTPVPTATPEPTATPLPIAFEASAALPLPDGVQLQRGRVCTVGGTVRSVQPLDRVWAEIKEDGETVHTAEEVFSAPVTEYALTELTFSRDIESFSEKLDLKALRSGSYTLALFASDASGYSTELASTSFTVAKETWIPLLPNYMRDNYDDALAFFGSPERFLFRFKVREGSSIALESEWSKQFVAKANCIDGSQWEVHLDAVPYFEQACRYLESTYICIRRADRAAGAIRLADIAEMNGTMVRRFTNDGAFISHHSFGTAVDFNAHTTSNKNRLVNRGIIFEEVTENLTYDGIETVDGKPCYCFTYTGAAREEIRGVPEPIANYLLYELALYRAGFGWGVYYPHTSDAMHFSLTELSPSLFTDGAYAMRKITEYIDPVTE